MELQLLAIISLKILIIPLHNFFFVAKSCLFCLSISWEIYLNVHLSQVSNVLTHTHTHTKRVTFTYECDFDGWNLKINSPQETVTVSSQLV